MNIRDKFKREIFKVDRKGIDKLVLHLDEKGFFDVPASKNYHLSEKGGLAKHSWNVFSYYKILADYFGVNNPEHPDSIDLDSMRIEALLHDITKIDEYKTNTISSGQNGYLKKLISDNKEIIKKNDIAFLENNEGIITEVKMEGETILLNVKSCSPFIDWLANASSFGKKPNKEEIKKLSNNNAWDYSEDATPLGHGSKSVILLQDFITLKEREKLAIYWHMSVFEGGVAGDYKKMKNLNKACKLYPDVRILQFADQMATFSEDMYEEKPENYKSAVYFLDKNTDQVLNELKQPDNIINQSSKKEKNIEPENNSKEDSNIKKPDKKQQEDSIKEIMNMSSELPGEIDIEEEDDIEKEFSDFNQTLF